MLLLDYVDDLLEEVINIVQDYKINQWTSEDIVESPPPLCSQYIHPEKSKAITEHRSRFTILNTCN